MHNCWNNGKLISINRGLVRLRVSYYRTKPQKQLANFGFGKVMTHNDNKVFLGTILTFCKHSSHSVIVWIEYVHCTCWSWIQNHAILSAIVTDSLIFFISFLNSRTDTNLRSWTTKTFTTPKDKLRMEFNLVTFRSVRSVPFIVHVLYYCVVECFETASNCCLSQLQFTKWGSSVLYIERVTRKLYKGPIEGGIRSKNCHCVAATRLTFDSIIISKITLV